MHSEPLVSVVLTTHNREGYARKAITSVLSQTFSNLQLIISDDSSSDVIRTLCESLRDLRISYYKNSPPLGMLLNTKRALRLATGRYVANMHDDDTWHPSFLEKMMAPMERDPSVGLVFCDHYIITDEDKICLTESDGNSKKWGRSSLSEGIILDKAKILFQGAISSPSGRLFRAGCISIDEIYDDVGVAYDWWMSFLHCKSEYNCYYLPERLMSYRVHSGSQTASWSETLPRDTVNALRRVLDSGNYAEYRSFIRGWLASSAITAAARGLVLGKRKTARACALTAIKEARSPACAVLYSLSFMPSQLSAGLISYLMNRRRR